MSPPYEFEPSSPALAPTRPAAHIRHARPPLPAANAQCTARVSRQVRRTSSSIHPSPPRSPSHPLRLTAPMHRGLVHATTTQTRPLLDPYRLSKPCPAPRTPLLPHTFRIVLAVISPPLVRIDVCRPRPPRPHMSLRTRCNSHSPSSFALPLPLHSLRCKSLTPRSAPNTTKRAVSPQNDALM